VIENSIGMKLVLIPPVVPVSTGANKLPQHTQNRPYRLGVYEVTRAQFRRFIAENPRYITNAEADNIIRLPIPGISAPRDNFDWRNPGVDALEDDHPVVWISWRDAMEFCKWLSGKEGRTYRLPTRAEWNWACKAGDSTFRTIPWTAANSGGHPHRVGELPVGATPTRWGLYNMLGNVHEPVMDRSGTLPPGYHPEDDLTENVYRRNRGGSFRLAPSHISFLFSEQEEGGRHMTNARDDTGFRVYCEP